MSILPKLKEFWKKEELTVSASGGVFGDIGTSPFYTMIATVVGLIALNIANNGVISESDIIGSVSCILYILLFVHFKYMIIAQKAHHNEAGGVIALAGLIGTKTKNTWLKFMAKWEGATGTSLLISDGVLTPAITLLSAVSGLAAPQAISMFAKTAGVSMKPEEMTLLVSQLESLVLPVAMVLAVVVTGAQLWPRVIGLISGPINIIYFLMIGYFGAKAIVKQPEILWALSPLSVVTFLWSHPFLSLISCVFGKIFLCATGGEACYADREHYGSRAIQKAWYFVSICIALNYMGQGAFALGVIKADAAETLGSINFYYALLPTGLMYVPCFIVSVLAAINASFALFPANHSNLDQAIAQGLGPKIKMYERNSLHKGQKCSPLFLLFLLSLILSVMWYFKTDTALQAAYGIGIVITMLFTDKLLLIWSIIIANWKKPVAIIVFGIFIVIDGIFFFSNISIDKIMNGGWVTLLLTISCLIPMIIWSNLRQITLKALRNAGEKKFIELKDFILSKTIVRVNGTCIFMKRRDDDFVPRTFLRQLEVQKNVFLDQKDVGNLVLKELNIILCVKTSETNAFVHHLKRVKSIQKFVHQGVTIARITVELGFCERFEHINEIVGAIIKDDMSLAFEVDSKDTKFYFSSEYVYDSRKNLFTKFIATTYNIMNKLQHYSEFGIDRNNIEFRKIYVDLAPKEYRIAEKERIKRMIFKIVNEPNEPCEEIHTH
jgi:KUP system potassium uptake protein